MNGSGMWSAVFWEDTSERVVASFAGTLLSEWTANSASTMFGLNLVSVDWKTSLGVAGGAALASLLKALVASGVGDPQSASLLRRVRWTAPAGKHEKAPR